MLTCTVCFHKLFMTCRPGLSPQCCSWHYQYILLLCGLVSRGNKNLHITWRVVWTIVSFFLKHFVNVAMSGITMLTFMAWCSTGQTTWTSAPCFHTILCPVTRIQLNKPHTTNMGEKLILFLHTRQKLETSTKRSACRVFNLLLA